MHLRFFLLSSVLYDKFQELFLLFVIFRKMNLKNSKKTVPYSILILKVIPNFFFFEIKYLYF